MAQDAASQGLLQGLCSTFPNPVPYLCSRWGEQMAIIKAAPEASALIAIVAFLLGLVLVRYHYKKRLVDTDKRLELRDDQIASLKVDNGKLELNNEKLQSQLKAETPASFSEIFTIEQREYEVRLRDKGGAMLPRPHSGCRQLRRMIRFLS